MEAYDAAMVAYRAVDVKPPPETRQGDLHGGGAHRAAPSAAAGSESGARLPQPSPSGEVRPSTALPDPASSSGQDATEQARLDVMSRSYSLGRAGGSLPHAAASSNAASRSGATARDEPPQPAPHPWSESDDASFASSVYDSERWVNPNGSESDGVPFQPPSAQLEEATHNIQRLEERVELLERQGTAQKTSLGDTIRGLRRRICVLEGSAQKAATSTGGGGRKHRYVTHRHLEGRHFVTYPALDARDYLPRADLPPTPRSPNFAHPSCRENC